MGERREWWANVYERGSGRHEASAAKWPTRAHASFGSCPAVKSRIHVRLKPEGAPKRYADETERYFWERAPNLMRHVA